MQKNTLKPLFKIGDLVLCVSRHDDTIKTLAVIIKIKTQEANGYSGHKIFYDMFNIFSNDISWLTEDNMLYFKKDSKRSNEYIEVIEV